MSDLAKYVEKWLAGQLELSPITALLGVRPLSLGQGEAKIELTAGDRLHNAMGTLHGGIFCDLADIAIGAALATVTAEGESFSTLQLQMSYFPAGRRRPPHRPRPRGPTGARDGPS
jgi:acyl-coenzyme A thioesterase PaaI-like protein